MRNEALENLVAIADQSTSRLLVSEVVRTAYALGKFDAAVEQTKAFISTQRARSLPVSAEVLS